MKNLIEAVIKEKLNPDHISDEELDHFKSSMDNNKNTKNDFGDFHRHKNHISYSFDGYLPCAMRKKNGEYHHTSDTYTPNPNWSKGYTIHPSMQHLINHTHAELDPNGSASHSDRKVSDSFWNKVKTGNEK